MKKHILTKSPCVEIGSITLKSKMLFTRANVKASPFLAIACKNALITLILFNFFFFFSFNRLAAQYYWPVKPTNIIDPILATQATEYAVEQAHSYIKDNQGNIYIAGAASSNNFIIKLAASNLSSPAWTINFYGGMGFEGIKHIFLGLDGNINALTANIDPTQDVDPGPGIVTIPSLRLADLVLLTYKPDGSYVSYKKLTETTGNAAGNPYINIYKATSDKNGNFYIYGNSYLPNNLPVTGTRDFDPGLGTVNIMDSYFLVKYDITGKLHWAKTIPNNVNRAISDLKFINGSVYVTGHFGGAMVDFDFGAGEYYLNAVENSSSDIFLAKYTAAAGAIDWAFGIGGSDWDNATTIMEEADGVRLFGTFYKSIDFDPTAGVALSDNKPESFNYGFTAKYGFDGSFKSGKRLTEGYSTTLEINSAIKDNQNNYYLVGGITSNGSGIDLDITSKMYAVYFGNRTYRDGVVAKYDANFNVQYGYSLGFYGSSDYASHVLMLNPNGSKMMVIGAYKSSFAANVDFDPNSGTFNLMSNRGSEELYAVTYCHLPETFPTPSNTWPPYVKQGQSGVVYSIDPIVGATGYSWTLPSGFTITSGANTNNITISASSTAASGTIVVRGKNDCGETEHYSFNVTTGSKNVPTITNFENMSKDYGTGSLVFQANSVSTGVISYSLLESTNNVTLTGNTLQIHYPGKYKIRAKIDEDDNYGTAFKDIVLTVGKGDYNTVFNNSSTTYGIGTFTLEANAPSVGGETIIFSILPGGTGVATLSGHNNSVATILQAGTVKLRAITLESDFSKQDTVEALLTINKATASIGVTNLTTTYSGRKQAPTVSFYPTDLTGVKTVYKVGEIVVANPINAGDYTVELSLDHVNYKATPVVKTFTINKAKLTVTIPNSSRAYNTSNPDVLLSYSDFVNNETVEVIDQLPGTFTNANNYSTPGVYNVYLSGGNDNNYYFSAVGGKLTIIKASQHITFPEIGDRNVYESPIGLSATSSAEIPIAYQVVSGPAYFSGPYLYFSGSLGTVTIRATQAGNGGYEPAEPVERTFKITNKTNQNISFDPIENRVYGDTPFSLRATGGNSGKPVIFSVVSGKVQIDGNLVIITGVGNVVIKASQEGNDEYNAAPQVTRSFNISKAAQAIDFPEINNIPFTKSIVDVQVSGGNSGLPVSLAVVAGNATISDGNKVKLGGVGSVTLKASQAGNENFVAATDVERTFVVTKGTQAVEFSKIEDQISGGLPIMLHAVSNQGLPIVYTVVAGKGQVNENTLTITGAGKITVKAIQEGDENFSSAFAEQTFCVKPSKPVITMDGTPTSAAFVLTSSSRAGNQWLMDGEEIPGATEMTYLVTHKGVYAVRVAFDGCSNVSDNVVLTSNEDPLAAENVKIYPTVTEGQLTIEFPLKLKDKTAISVCNEAGVKLKEVVLSYGQSSISLDLSTYTSGMYFVQISNLHSNSFYKVIKR